MTRRDFIITTILAALSLLIFILLIRALGTPSPRVPGIGLEEVPRVVAPPPVPPVSVTPGLTTWTGILTLTDSDALFFTGGRSYPLLITAVGQSSKILRERGYLNGERIHILGKVTGAHIEAAGVSR